VGEGGAHTLHHAITATNIPFAEQKGKEAVKESSPQGGYESPPHSSSLKK